MQPAVGKEATREGDAAEARMEDGRQRLLCCSVEAGAVLQGEITEEETGCLVGGGRGSGKVEVAGEGGASVEGRCWKAATEGWGRRDGGAWAAGGGGCVARGCGSSWRGGARG